MLRQSPFRLARGSELRDEGELANGIYEIRYTMISATGTRKKPRNSGIPTLNPEPLINVVGFTPPLFLKNQSGHDTLSLGRRDSESENVQGLRFRVKLVYRSPIGFRYWGLGLWDL